MPKHSSSDDSESGSEQDFSGSENEPTWEQAKNFKIRFGRYKGKRLGQLITTKKRRNYLKYLLGWDKLREDGRANIKCVMEHYQELKATASKCAERVQKECTESSAENSAEKTQRAV